ncbi:heterokaryon incompatibility protein [Apiospora marii]|uniref:Heterokaryon incompatibility protein n=1 Tax=Apiospora marii TaxID=335849 RepID=A0ABR1SUP3_9PEZI
MTVDEVKARATTPIAAGEWLVHLCQKEGAIGRVLTALENDKFNEFFEEYGQDPEFEKYHVEAIHRSLTGKDYRLAQALLAKDDPKTLLLDDACALQIAIKAVRIQPDCLDRSIKESAPELLDTVKLLMDHGAVANSLDENGNSALFYTCVLGYAELFTLLCESGADVRTTHRRRLPEQLRQSDGDKSEANEEMPENVNLLQVTLDALISPQKILDFTWIGYPPGMNYDHYQWKADLDATWGAIVLRLLQEGLLCASDDLGLIQLLHVSCYQGAVRYVTSLLGFGASIDAPSQQSIDECGRHHGRRYGTALHAASATLQITVARKLLQHGADPRASRPCGYSYSLQDLTPVGLALRAHVNGVDEKESGKELEFCEAIMQAEPSLDEQDYLKLIDFCAQRNNLEFIRQLLQRGIRPPQMPDTDNLDVIVLLLERGVEVDPARLQKKAVKRNRMDILRWSISHHGGQLPDDPEGWGSIMLQVTGRRPKAKGMLEFLISEYPGPHIDTVLSIQRKNLKVTTLNKEKQKREKMASEKTNLLLLALEAEDPGFVKIVLDAGADPKCPGLPEDSLAAFQKIVQRNNNNLDESLEIVRLLQEKLLGGTSWIPPTVAETRAKSKEIIDRKRGSWEARIERLARTRHECLAPPRTDSVD